MSSAPSFLEKLATAERKCGLYLFHYLQQKERDEAFRLFDSELFPWEKKPKLYGERLPQHAFYFKRTSSADGNAALAHLESLCKRIETEFDVQVYDVYCNRFVDPSHNQEWHKDTFGAHIFVLSLGSTRRVEWRSNATKEIDSVTPNAGDMYLMPLGLNKTHKHRVCAGEESDGTRISLVFFIKTPKYAGKEFKVSFADKLKGFVEDAMSNPN
ncbi:hypothetical protein ACHAWF_001769 [Thalassiosira exigua]